MILKGSVFPIINQSYFLGHGLKVGERNEQYVYHGRDE